MILAVSYIGYKIVSQGLVIMVRKKPYVIGTYKNSRLEPFRRIVNPSIVRGRPLNEYRDMQ